MECELQADAQWRKIQVKLEGEDEYEALDKFDRLEVFQEHIRCVIVLWILTI
jgi:pre-mRNA-processing factor 40